MPSENHRLSPNRFNLRTASLALALLLTISSTSFSASPLPGQPGWDSGFDAQRAMQHVRVLASDSLKGRYSGFQGTDKANLYIGGHFSDLKLEPPWGRDGYMHRFNYGAGEYLMPSGLVAHFGDGSVDTANFWQEINVFKYSGFGKVRAKLVFVGYGISSPENGWDDYAGVDVKGAIVLAWRGTPQIEGKSFGSWGASGRKSTNALSKGAIGFVFCENDPPKLATITEDYYREELPAVWVSKTFADTLLKGTGKTKDQWKQLVDSLKTPISRVLDVEVEMQVSGKYYPKRKTQNLAGLLLGSDPILRNEIVVVGAHMDHHGVDPAGNIYPGADDNASGTSTMMELARVFTEKKLRSKRSIMFMGFAAEEEGLCGSKAFVKEMRLPKGMEIVAMLNMDMVGQGNCSLGVGGISEYPVLGEALFAGWPDSSLKPIEFHGLYDASDHASFRDAGISSYVIGALGAHPNYHTPGDSAANIKPEVMQAVGDMMFHCANSLASYPTTLKPFSGRGQWLVNKYGGVREMEIATKDINWIPNHLLPAQSYRDKVNANRMSYSKPQDRLSGVEYTVPMTIFNIVKHDEDSRKYDVMESTFLQAIELSREWAKSNGAPYLSDSTLKGYNGNPFRGVTSMITRSNFPADSLVVKALAELGLGFIRTGLPVNESWDKGLWLNDTVLDGSKTVPGARSVAYNARRAGIRPWINSLPPDPNNRPVVIPEEFTRLWGSQVICDFTTVYQTNIYYWLPQKGVEPLLGYGWFLLIRDIDLMKKYRGKPEWKQIGIPSDAPLVEELLNQGFKEDEIGDLLFNNLQRTLQEWWADESYRKP